MSAHKTQNTCIYPITRPQKDTLVNLIFVSQFINIVGYNKNRSLNWGKYNKTQYVWMVDTVMIRLCIFKHTHTWNLYYVPFCSIVNYKMCIILIHWHTQGAIGINIVVNRIGGTNLFYKINKCYLFLRVTSSNIYTSVILSEPNV